MARSRRNRKDDKPKVKHVEAKTENQKEYIRAIIENDIVFCSGPSGSGKSTLLRLIAGLPVAAEFEGYIEADDKQDLSDRVGYMAQQDLLLEWATITC